MSPDRASAAPRVGQRFLDAGLRNETVRVAHVAGRPRLIRRLAALGVVPGVILTVLKAGNPVIVAKGGARLAIGAAAASSIEIEEV